MRKISAALLFTLALSSCMVGLNYRRPSIPAPQNWRFEEPEALDTVDTPWWKQFGDPVLDELVETAVKENKDVLIAAGRVEEFMGRAAIARAAQFPQVAAGAAGSQQAVTNYMNPAWPSTAENPYWEFQTFLTASWQIDLWGQLRRASEAARADLLATEEGRRGVILTVVTAAATAYTDLLDLDKQLDIAQETAISREQTLKLFRLRYDRGLISELELSQAESECRSAEATLPLLRKLIGQQENALSILLGRNPGPIVRGKPLDHLVLPAVPAGLPSQLLEAPRHPPGRAEPDRRERQDRRRKGPILPDHLPHRPVRRPKHGPVQSVSRSRQDMDLRAPHCRPRLYCGLDRGEREGRRGSPKRDPAAISAGDPTGFQGSGGWADRPGKDEGATPDAAGAGGGPAGIRAPRAAPLRERLHQLHRGARRRAESFRRRAELYTDPGGALPGAGEPL